MLKYVEIEEAGRLEIVYEGPPLDLHTIGHLQIELHQVIDNVAFATLFEENRIRDYYLFERLPLSPRRISWLRRRFPNRYFDVLGRDRWMFPPGYEKTPIEIPLIRATCHRAAVGSWYQEIGFAAASLFMNPDVRASLQGVGGNILYAILNCGLRGIEVVKGKVRRHHSVPQDFDLPLNYDPYDIGPNLMNIAKHLVEHGGADAKSLTIKHKIKDGESEVQIRLR